jgi:hypothetical protein
MLRVSLKRQDVFPSLAAQLLQRGAVYCRHFSACISGFDTFRSRFESEGFSTISESEPGSFLFSADGESLVMFPVDPTSMAHWSVWNVSQILG